MNILAIIPARSGSKSILHKNIKKINNKPMLAYSIEHAKSSKYINRIIVSTDSDEYAHIAKEHGAEVPFLRPIEYAGDTSTDFEVFYHALSYLRDHEGYMPEIVVQLRPTYPIRDVDDIDNMIKIIMDNENLDSVRSITMAKEIPYKMWLKSENGKIIPLIKDIKECYNMPRQQLPTAYYQNACIDVIRTKVILIRKSMSGENIYGYEMTRSFDIDTEEEFKMAEDYIKITKGLSTFVFDIDGVIATIQKDLDYALAEPNNEMIKIVNKLYDMGNKIVLFTARGYVTGIDWKDVTKNQMDTWGVKYTELKLGKPNGDYYVDDRMIELDILKNMF